MLFFQLKAVFWQTEQIFYLRIFFWILGCGKLFVEEQQLDVHFKHHENYTPRTGKHKCHLCKEAFFQKDMLKRHVLSTHNEVSSFRSRGKQPSKSRRHCHTATSLKGGLISDGIFTFVPTSKKCDMSNTSNYSTWMNLNKVKKLMMVIWHIFRG